MKHVDIYTDGACTGNPGPGGWGAILVYRQIEKEICGGEPDTTNNRMELTAAIEALRMLKESCEVTLTSDSQYLVSALNEHWVDKWQENHWNHGKNGHGSPVPNADLWQHLLEAAAPHNVTWVWVRGHNGHPYNERCDRLATGFIDQHFSRNP
ncbi:MAG: ribonuclease HI [Clostridia bacterium]|nr:ribonuclease HI [Clostridia bacterium]